MSRKQTQQKDQETDTACAVNSGAQIADERMKLTQLILDVTDDAVENVIDRYLSYSGAPQGNRIRDAYVFAKEAHAGQIRMNGEPYIIHPVAATEILVDLEVDEDTLVAALLHDTVEDTDVTLEQVEERFGATVSKLVDGVTKLSRIAYSSKEEPKPKIFARCFSRWRKISVLF